MQISIKPYKNINFTQQLSYQAGPEWDSTTSYVLTTFTTETLEPHVIVATDSGIALGTAVCLIKH